MDKQDHKQNRMRTLDNHTTAIFSISDELWAVLQPLLPVHVNTHRTGGGRPRVPDRDCADAIFYVLRTGCHWQALDQTGLCGHWAARDRFQEWVNTGVFRELWQVGLEQFDELCGINWDWLNKDGAMTEVPLDGEKTGLNPINRSKDQVKHACSRCHHRYSQQTMKQVSLQNGEYRAWTPERAAYFRRCRLKRPMLIWLCGVCGSSVQEDKYQSAGW